MLGKKLALTIGAIAALAIITFLAYPAPVTVPPNSPPAENEISLNQSVPSVNPDLGPVIGGILEQGETFDAMSFESLVSSLVQGDKEGYLEKLAELKTTLPQKRPSEVVIKGRRSDETPYRGLFLDSIREVRWVLAHVDKVKAVGIDTLMIDLQLDAYKENGSIYLPGEETYFFYLNAFHKSGFRVWLAPAATSYDFPYAWWSDPERPGALPPLEDQRDLLERVEPHIYRWAELSELYNVDTFIPAEEANNLVMDTSYTKTNLCRPEREELNSWMQEILPQIKQLFSGKVGFATNDGGPCEDQMREGPKKDAPDFDYRGYDFIIQKTPFPSIFNFPNNTWERHMDNFITNTLDLLERDNVTGLLFYETGDTVGKALREDFAGSLPVRESTPEEQAESYGKDFWAMGKSDKILGMLFKIAGPQPHEPDWNPFERPAEEVLRENFAKYGTLNLTETDKTWIAIGEDGLKAIQICLSKNSTMPFDTESILNHDEFEALASRVRPIC